MKTQFDVRREYAKDRDQQDENKYFVIGMTLVNCIGIVATPDQQPST